MAGGVTMPRSQKLLVSLPIEKYKIRCDNHLDRSQLKLRSQLSVVQTSDVVTLHRWSPYTDICAIERGLLLTHRLTNESFLLDCDAGSALAKLQPLESGVQYERLTDLCRAIVGNAYAEDLVAQLWQHGLIE